MAISGTGIFWTATLGTDKTGTGDTGAGVTGTEFTAANDSSICMIAAGATFGAVDDVLLSGKQLAHF